MCERERECVRERKRATEKKYEIIKKKSTSIPRSIISVNMFQGIMDDASLKKEEGCDAEGGERERDFINSFMH